MSACKIHRSNPGPGMQMAADCCLGALRRVPHVHAHAQAAPELPAVLIGNSRLLIPAFNTLLQKP